MDLEAAPAGQVLAAEHAAEGLTRVGVSVEDVNLQVALLAGTDVAAVRTMPASESFHHHNISEAVLECAAC